MVYLPRRYLKTCQRWHVTCADLARRQFEIICISETRWRNFPSNAFLISLLYLLYLSLLSLHVKIKALIIKQIIFFLFFLLETFYHFYFFGSLHPFFLILFFFSWLNLCDSFFLASTERRWCW
jgi:hypothetical protein